GCVESGFSLGDPVTQQDTGNDVGDGRRRHEKSLGLVPVGKVDGEGEEQRGDPKSSDGAARTGDRAKSKKPEQPDGRHEREREKEVRAQESQRVQNDVRQLPVQWMRVHVDEPSWAFPEIGDGEKRSDASASIPAEALRLISGRQRRSICAPLPERETDDQWHCRDEIQKGASSPRGAGGARGKTSAKQDEVGGSNPHERSCDDAGREKRR